ncbi:MAG: SEC-C metal-binding domain-containing protein, partial [Acidimicrobiales bacterium]
SWPGGPGGGGWPQVEVVAPPAVLDKAAVAALRAAYDRAVAEPGLPVSTKELVLEMIFDDRRSFERLHAPLDELIAAAGLERRGNNVADGPGPWRRGQELRQVGRVVHRFHDSGRTDAAMKVIRLFNEGEWPASTPLREAAAALGADAEVAEAVASELLVGRLEQADEDAPTEGDGPEDLPLGPEGTEGVAHFAGRLVDAARKPVEMAAARWLAARAAEAAGDLALAEAQLHLAVDAAGNWGPAVDRLAWYLSDKGEAVEAAQLWRSLGIDRRDPEVANVEELARSAGAKLGRNEPCWCGSGRKFKLCHLGKPVLAPLPERVGWLAGKAVSYLRRQPERAGGTVFTVATARADGRSDEKAMAKAFSDPLTLDLVLAEGGWFERFLHERGPLLPDDEALLATSWAMVDRTIYEVVSVRPGTGVTVKDLRSAEEVDVRERTFSQEASPGVLVCARAVPDGEGHQFIGGVFDVRAGTEAQLLDLLDEGDPEAIAAWVARLERPPVLRTREWDESCPTNAMPSTGTR